MVRTRLLRGAVWSAAAAAPFLLVPNTAFNPAPAPLYAPLPAPVAETAVVNAARPSLAAIEAVAPRETVVRLDAPAHSAYVPAPDPANPILTVDPALKLGLDLTGVRDALDAYGAGDLARGDEAARAIRDPIAATAVEWAALRAAPKEAGHKRIAAFIAAHPDWPTLEPLRRASEEALYAANPTPAATFAFFAQNPPVSAIGKIAMARARAATGETVRAAEIVRAVWREETLSGWLEGVVLKSFGDALRPDDHRVRALRRLYKDDAAAGLRAAALASKDTQTVAQALLNANRETSTEKTFAAVPPAVQKDAAFQFAKIQFLRRANRIPEAAELMLKAPRAAADIVDGDEWWIERRVLARKTLDAGDPLSAYKIVAGHGAIANDMQVDAEFHAGWIALRFLGDAIAAVPHFENALALARTPISRARAAYWRGRAAELTGEDPNVFYDRAAAESATFYGQIARLRRGVNDVPTRRARAAAEGADRAESVRVVEMLYAAGARHLAVPLAYAAAKTLTAPEQMAALARVAILDRDAKVSLTLGKFAAQRGFAMDDLAFPIFGVPSFAPHVNSAPLEIVYAIARQESAFDAKAVSHAGAMGLMQMIASTARRTAQRVGVAFEPARMTTDPTFNAQLGAAHLGDLLVEQRNSLILTFAAYNAGGKRVREWIAAYGDPRHPKVDPIDWIERIPIYETRNYVQRVLENLTVYRARLQGDGAGEAAAAPLKQEARL